MNYYLLEMINEPRNKYIVRGESDQEATKALRKAKAGGKGYTTQKINPDANVFFFVSDNSKYIKREGRGCIQSVYDKGLTVKKAFDPIVIWMEARDCNNLVLER